MSFHGFPDWQDVNLAQGQPLVNRVNRQSVVSESLGPFFVGSYPGLFAQFIPEGTLQAYDLQFVWYADQAATIEVGSAHYSFTRLYVMRDQLHNAGPWMKVFILADAAPVGALHDFQIIPIAVLHPKGRAPDFNSLTNQIPVNVNAGGFFTVLLTTAQIGDIDVSMQATTPNWTLAINSFDYLALVAHFVAGDDGNGTKRSSNLRFSGQGRALAINMQNQDAAIQTFSFGARIAIGG